MVTVTNFFEVQTKDGRTFINLEITGGLELVQSQTTGNFYATVRRCRIPSTFDASIAKLMVGQQLDGDVIRVQVEPYNYANPKTGELLMLAHSYSYRPKGAIELIGETRIEKLDTL